MSQERDAIRQIAEWYRKDGLDVLPTYVNHTAFFYLLGRDPRSANFHRLTQETLQRAPELSIVIWENHYSQRLVGDVRIEQLADDPSFDQPGKMKTADGRFTVAVFQKM